MATLYVDMQTGTYGLAHDLAIVTVTDEDLEALDKETSDKAVIALATRNLAWA